MTCLENVQAGQHLNAARPLLPRLLRLPPAAREERRLQTQALETLARVGLDFKAAHLARNLSYGERRRLEIARALALATRACSCWTSRWPACAGAKRPKWPTSCARSRGRA